MVIPDTKIAEVQTFISRLFSLETEEEALRFICPAIAEIVHADFYAIYLFPNILSKKPLFYTNNSTEYLETYRKHLGYHDIFTHEMISGGNKPVHFRELVTPAFYEKSFFLNECDKIRGKKTRDGCYIPFIVNGFPAGYIGFGRYEDHPYNYSVDELKLLYFLVSFIPPAFEQILTGPPPDADAALLNGYGKVVSAGSRMKSFLKAVFGGTYWEHPCMDPGENGSVFKSAFDDMMFRRRFLGRREICLGRKDFEQTISFRLFNTSDSPVREYFPGKPQLSINIKIVGFDTGYLDLDSSFRQYSISSREQELIRLLYRGLSNANIAAELQISEATVKHHLYNIYNKTGVDSRTQLIFLLTGGKDI